MITIICLQYRPLDWRHLGMLHPGLFTLDQGESVKALFKTEILLTRVKKLQHRPLRTRGKQFLFPYTAEVNIIKLFFLRDSRMGQISQSVFLLQPFQPSLIFGSLAGAQPGVEYMKRASLRFCSQTFRLGLKGMPTTNTLAYLSHLKVTNKLEWLFMAGFSTLVSYFWSKAPSYSQTFDQARKAFQGQALQLISIICK